MASTLSASAPQQQAAQVRFPGTGARPSNVACVVSAMGQRRADPC